VATATTAFVLAIAAPADAQRRPNGVPPGLAKQQPSKNPGSGGTSTPPGGTPSPVLEGPLSSARIRSFGSWLDDASTLAPGEAWLTLSAQHWASPSFSGSDLPVIDLSVGLVDRVHAFVMLPITSYGYEGAERVREVGDVYVGAKIALRSADAGGLGLSTTPALEIVGSDSLIDSGMQRISLAVPVNVEWRRGRGRVYGSAGFYTRGAWFAGGALERQLSNSFVATGALSLMGSTEDRAVSEFYGLHHRRVDASGSIAWIPAPTVVLYAGVGRTLSAMDIDATRYAFSVSAALNIRRPGARPPLPR
jgi:hypothetical protein